MRLTVRRIFVYLLTMLDNELCPEDGRNIILIAPSTLHIIYENLTLRIKIVGETKNFSKKCDQIIYNLTI